MSNLKLQKAYVSQQYYNILQTAEQLQMLCQLSFSFLKHHIQAKKIVCEEKCSNFTWKPFQKFQEISACLKQGLIQ